MYEPRWIHPKTTADAAAALAEEPGRARPVAGATDLAVHIRASHDGPETLVDLTCVDELAAVRVDGGRLSIGAAATHALVAEHPVVGERAAVLAQACGTVGAPQIRARGTIGGNIANASPAADATVALVALDAVATLVSARGERDIPVAELFTGPGSTVLEPDELLTRVGFDLPGDEATSVYRKVGQRKALAIAIASVAATYDPATGAVRIALGSVAPTIIRATGAEAVFAAGGDVMELIGAAAAEAARASSPIDDVRASAEYRAILVEELTRTALEELVLAGPRVSG